MIKIKNASYNVKNLICVTFAVSEKNQKSYTILEFTDESKKFIEVQSETEHNIILNDLTNYLK